MKKLFVALVLMAGLWIVGEIAIVPLAESKVEQRAAAQVEGEASVTADIDSFPLAARVLLTGVVDRMSMRFEEIARQQLTFADLEIVVEGIEVDRGSILDQKLRVTAIDRGTVTATIDASALPPLARRVIGQARVSDRALILGPVSFQLASDVLPCPPDVRVEEDRIILSCSIDEIPEALIDAAQSS
jgi:hypothetical protein